MKTTKFAAQNFLRQYLAVVAMALLTVAGAAFVCLPYTLSGQASEQLATTDSARHLS
jgi:hypothetical protein